MGDFLEPDIRWGILATGKIARVFAADLALVPGSTLQAVGSRRIESAEAFAAEHGAHRAHGSYAELLADPDVDIVYVATPHSRHFRDVRACFAAGKAVLCEKPLTLDAVQARELIDEARARKLFFSEAMWMRTNPNIRAIKAMVDDGALDVPLQMRAELGFVAGRTLARMWDPALGASALLDVGIYPLTLAHLLLGAPSGVSAAGVLDVKGFDTNAGATLTYDSGAVASLAWTQTSWGDHRASISGAGGRLEWEPMNEPRSFTYARGDELDTYAEGVLGAGYAHEIVEVGDCLRAGRTESAVLPLDETLAILQVMDEIRAQLRTGMAQ